MFLHHHLGITVGAGLLPAGVQEGGGREAHWAPRLLPELIRCCWIHFSVRFSHLDLQPIFRLEDVSALVTLADFLSSRTGTGMQWNGMGCNGMAGLAVCRLHSSSPCGVFHTDGFTAKHLKIKLREIIHCTKMQYNTVCLRGGR